MGVTILHASEIGSKEQSSRMSKELNAAALCFDFASATLSTNGQWYGQIAI